MKDMRGMGKAKAALSQLGAAPPADHKLLTPFSKLGASRAAFTELQ